MTKFHINKHGMPAPCKAKPGNCPLGGDDRHYDTKEETQAAIDRENEKQHGLLPNVNNENVTEINISQEDFDDIFPNSWNDHGYQVTGPHLYDFRDFMNEDSELSKPYTDIYNQLPNKFFDKTKNARYWRLVKADNIESHMSNHVINLSREEAEDSDVGYENMVKTIEEKVGSKYPGIINYDNYEDEVEIDYEFEDELSRFAVEKVKEESFLKINGETFYVSIDEELNRNWAEEYFNTDNFEKYIKKGQ
ncbi:MAG TPA: hypothetical protein GXZ90_04570 [Clostridiales bacterium]|nr:hypothetical protein [Clostridiales bacterium]